jgi:uncharacterized delta-60 repeat protein
MWNMNRSRALTPSWLTTSLCLLILGVPVAPALAATVVSETIWGTAGPDTSAAVAVAADGSRYVAGTAFSDSGSNSRLFVVKFSADGSVVWQRAWVGGLFGASARGVAVAADGSVYVAGFAFVAPNAAILLKFDTDGALQWQRSWGGSAFPEDVAVAADGSVYVAGSVRLPGAFNQRISLTRFAPDGSVVSHQVWATPESQGETQGQGLTVGADGSVYVAGVTPRFAPDGTLLGFDVALLKVAPNGSLTWQRTVTAGEGADSRGGVTAAPDGSVYVAGGRFDPRTSDLNALLLKFTPEGSLVWNRNWGGRSGDEAGGVAVGADGTVFLAGNTNSFGSGSDDVFLLQLTPGGKPKAAVTWGSAVDPGSGFSDHADDVAIAPDGNVVIGATAWQGPYALLSAPTHAAKDKAVIGTPAFPLEAAADGVADPGGVVSDIADGSAEDRPGHDAALLVIAP